MSETTVTLVVPTITGREKSFARTLASYRDGTGVPYTQTTVKGYKTIGAAWVDVLPGLTTDLAHLTTDDVTAESRWANEIRLEWDEHRGLAVPLVMRMPGETLESHGAHGVMHTMRTEVGWCGVPVVPSCCFVACAEALSDAGSPHYYSDNVICDVLRAHGHQLIARPAYRLGHWWEAGGADGSSFGREDAAWRAWRANAFAVVPPDPTAHASAWENWAHQAGEESHV